MPSYCKVIALGHVTRDPQLKYLPNQTPVCEFGIAVNRKYKDKEDVTFLDCTAFGKQAETLNQYIKKGSALLIDGHPRQDNWEDKQTGQKRSKIGIVIDSFQFVGGREDQEEQYPRDRKSVTSRPRHPMADLPDSGGVPADDIPFAWEGRQQQAI